MPIQHRFATTFEIGQKLTVLHLTNRLKYFILTLHSTTGGLYDYKC